MKQIREVVGKGEVTPQKSTDFHPERSGRRWHGRWTQGAELRSESDASLLTLNEMRAGGPFSRPESESRNLHGNPIESTQKALPTTYRVCYAPRRLAGWKSPLFV